MAQRQSEGEGSGFDLFDEPNDRTKAINGSMNQLIADGARRGTGPISQLAGEVTSLDDRRAQALTDLELAHQSHDRDRIALAEHAFDRVRAESREARGLDQPRNDHGTFAGSFDGGVRGVRRVPRGPHREPESAGHLFARMIAASRQETRERQQEHAIHTT